MDHKSEKCMTITFSDVVENGIGMQKLGKLTKSKFTYEYLLDKYHQLNDHNYNVEFIELSIEESKEKACVIVLRNYVQNPNDIMSELSELDWDKKAIFRGVVKNKLARHNLCFADMEQEPDYASGKGRIIKFETLPCLNVIRSNICEEFEMNLASLLAEGNLYYDVKKCGIGYHGDTERSTVIGLRLGESMKLCFQWFHMGKPIGEKTTLTLNGGDLYIMSSKAVGNDWKKRSQYTLRHAAGCDKYTIWKDKTKKINK